MFGIENNAMLIVINIRGILQTPLAVVNGNRNNPVILAGGEVYASRISLTFTAEHTFRISALHCGFGGGDCFGVLFRLRKVNGNIKVTLFRGGHPFNVLFNSVTADIIAVATEFIKIIGSILGRLFVIQFIKFFRNF